MAETNNNLIQARLMHLMKDLIPPHLTFSQELATILEISTDSAYRRIRGDISLTIEEIEKLSQHFKISIDHLIKHENHSACFNYTPINSRADMVTYMAGVRNDMIRISQAPNNEITYASIDIPIFHVFKKPEYIHFKLFYWLNSVVKDPEYQSREFSVEQVDPQLVSAAIEMSELYAGIPSTEIWSESVMLSTIKQIEYAWLSGLFASIRDVEVLIHKIRESIECVQSEARDSVKYYQNGGTKVKGAKFLLYQSDIEIGNNTILVKMGDTRISYSTFNTFNRMYTNDQEYCRQSEIWLNNLKKQASLISDVAERERFQFFKKIYLMLDRLWEKIEANHKQVI